MEVWQACCRAGAQCHSAAGVTNMSDQIPNPLFWMVQCQAPPLLCPLPSPPPAPPLRPPATLVEAAVHIIQAEAGLAVEGAVPTNSDSIVLTAADSTALNTIARHDSPREDSLSCCTSPLWVAVLSLDYDCMSCTEGPQQVQGMPPADWPTGRNLLQGLGACG